MGKWDVCVQWVTSYMKYIINTSTFLNSLRFIIRTQPCILPYLIHLCSLLSSSPVYYFTVYLHPISGFSIYNLSFQSKSSPNFVIAFRTYYLLHINFPFLPHISLTCLPNLLVAKVTPVKKTRAPPPPPPSDGDDDESAHSESTFSRQWRGRIESICRWNGRISSTAKGAGAKTSFCSPTSNTNPAQANLNSSLDNSYQNRLQQLQSKAASKHAKIISKAHLSKATSTKTNAKN